MLELLRIMIWESDEKSRQFGETLQAITKEIQGSQLTNVLSLISMVASAPVATVYSAFQAATELAGLVGAILKHNSNDYVDYFEGCYPVGEPWGVGPEHNVGTSTEIVLEKL